jgi:hypothetical protein
VINVFVDALDLGQLGFDTVAREMGLLATASVAINGRKFKAVSNRDKNFTRVKMERRRTQLEESVARYLSQLDTADRQEPTEALATKVTRLHDTVPEMLAENQSRIITKKLQNSGIYDGGLFVYHVVSGALDDELLALRDGISKLIGMITPDDIRFPRYNERWGFDVAKIA